MSVFICLRMKKQKLFNELGSDRKVGLWRIMFVTYLTLIQDTMESSVFGIFKKCLTESAYMAYKQHPLELAHREKVEPYHGSLIRSLSFEDWLSPGDRADASLPNPDSPIGNQLSRSPGIEDWDNVGPKADARLQSLLQKTSSQVPTLPSLLLARPTNWLEPTSCPKAATSPYKTWVGSTEIVDNKVKTHNSSSPLRNPVALLIKNHSNDCDSSPSNLNLKRKAPPSHAPPFKKASVVDDFFCKVCLVRCSGGLAFRQHINGRAHKAKLMWRKSTTQHETNRNIESYMGKWKCDICQVCCTDAIGLEMHFKGSKHNAKLNELEHGKKNGSGSNAKKILRCDLCMVNCIDEECYEVHLMGKQHLSRVQLKRAGVL